MENDTMTSQEAAISNTEAPASSDPAQQTSAVQCLEILRTAGFAAIVNLMEEGIPLSERQISNRLKIPRGQAKKMLTDARELLIQQGIVLPEPERPVMPKKKKPKIKLRLRQDLRRPGKKITLKTKSSKRKLTVVDVKVINESAAPLKPFNDCCASPAAKSLMQELLLATVLSDPHGAIGILTRFASQSSSPTQDATATKSIAA